MTAIPCVQVFFAQSDHSISETTAQVLLTDDTGAPLSDIPTSIIDNGSKTEWIESLHLQDEWKIVPTFTVNYGCLLYTSRCV